MAKLVDILARELKVWPEGATYAQQDADKEIRFHGFSEQNYRHDFYIGEMSEDGCPEVECAGAGVSVTREQWQAARDALSKPAVPVIDWSKAPEGATHYCLSSNDGTYWRDLSGEFARYWLDDQWNRHGGLKSAEILRSPIKLVERPAESAWNGNGLPPVGVNCEAQTGSSWVACVIVAHHVVEGRRCAVWVTLDGWRSGIWGAPSFRPIRTAEQIEAEKRETIARQICIDAGSPECTEHQMQTAYKLYDAGWQKVAQ